MIIVYNQKQIRPIISGKHVKISESPLFSSAYEWIRYLGVMLGLWVLQKPISGKKAYAWGSNCRRFVYSLAWREF